jgi:hypothetical protein
MWMQALESRPHRAGVGSPLLPLGSHEKNKKRRAKQKQANKTPLILPMYEWYSFLVFFSFLLFSKKNNRSIKEQPPWA